MKKEYYVYVLQNPKKPLKHKTDKYGLDHEPFYIGKGTGKRSEAHLDGVIKRDEAHNTRLWSEINLIRSYGKTPIVTKVFTSENESLVYAKEAELINHYGLRYKDGLLVNVSTGKAGGWGGASNPTFDRMDLGTHNFQVNNPQYDTPQVTRLKKMILEVSTSSQVSDSKWLKRTGYSTLKALKIGINRIISRDKLKYKLVGSTLTSLNSTSR